ncbi:thioredoxin domain-containing protein [Moritella sp.]|uniref:DsbA family protein n=1 Tax=Moritella sp. TaxID=78556 RepID=UPI001DF491DB|nr:thioredoxin domain-containing protein [Moritella sp.]MCJ8349929.1 DsbA family protein [Moritella sp.]NQZ39778.1 thioredoxin domain-containing protein [Moritella sp.]
MKKLSTKKSLEVKKRNKIISIAVLCIAVVITALSFTSKESINIDQHLYSQNDLIFGNKYAKVTIVEFFDPACESCRAFYPLVKSQIKKYKGKVNLIVRPVAFHRNVGPVVAALEATKMQGKFWESLGTTLNYQSRWAINHVANVDLLYPYLQDIGVDIEKLKIDVKNPAIAESMAQGALDAKTLKVLKTPTFYVNGTELKRFGAEQLKALIAKEVSKAYPGK